MCTRQMTQLLQRVNPPGTSAGQGKNPWHANSWRAVQKNPQN